MANNIIEDFLDSTYAFVIAQDPTYPWVRSNGVAPNGDAGHLYSSNTAHLSTAIVTLDVTVPTGTTRSWIEVDWAVSSELNYDFFNILVDGVNRFSASGTRSGTFLYDMAAGLHKLRFTYYKDRATSTGADRAYVTGVRLMHEDTGARVKIAELRLGSGDQIPVYDISGNGIQPLRIMTSDGLGFIPLVATSDPSASRIRLRTANIVKALEGSTVITLIVWDGGTFQNTAFPRTLDGGTFASSAFDSTVDGGTF